MTHPTSRADGPAGPNAGEPHSSQAGEKAGRLSRALRFARGLVRNERGNSLVIAGAGIFALVGSAGLGTDTVQWYLWKRQLQQATDAGSLAGAYAIQQGSTNYAGAAQTEITRNANTAVTVEALRSPPQSGAFAGNARAVEVIATTSTRLPFSSLFLGVAPTVRTRSVASAVTIGEHCVLALAPTGVGVNVAGNANVQLDCGVAANSSAANGIYLEGSSHLDGSPLTSVGGIVSGTSNTPEGTELQPYASPQVDPMLARNLQVPTSPSTCTATSLVVDPNQTRTISPGRYCNGLTLKGNVTLSPGVYIVDRGSFRIESQATVTGNGVTIVLTGSNSGDIAVTNIAGGATVNLRAPTAVEDPVWRNVLFYQDPRAESRLSEIAGGSNINLQGIIYMPGGNIRFAGNSGYAAECLFLVANAVTMTGTAAIRNNCPADYNQEDFSMRTVRVVE